MNTNRSMMRTRMADLEIKQRRLQQQAKIACDALIPLVNPTLMDIEDMEIAQAAILMDDLVMHQAELLSIKAKIQQLNEAIYG